MSTSDRTSKRASAPSWGRGFQLTTLSPHAKKADCVVMMRGGNARSWGEALPPQRVDPLFSTRDIGKQGLHGVMHPLFHSCGEHSYKSAHPCDHRYGDLRPLSVRSQLISSGRLIEDGLVGKLGVLH